MDRPLIQRRWEDASTRSRGASAINDAMREAVMAEGRLAQSTQSGGLSQVFGGDAGGCGGSYMEDGEGDSPISRGEYEGRSAREREGNTTQSEAKRRATSAVPTSAVPTSAVPPRRRAAETPCRQAFARYVALVHSRKLTCILRPKPASTAGEPGLFRGQGESNDDDSQRQ